jgi:hypothetical protein
MSAHLRTRSRRTETKQPSPKFDYSETFHDLENVASVLAISATAIGSREYSFLIDRASMIVGPLPRVDPIYNALRAGIPGID